MMVITFLIILVFKSNVRVHVKVVLAILTIAHHVLMVTGSTNRPIPSKHVIFVIPKTQNVKPVKEMLMHVLLVLVTIISTKLLYRVKNVRILV
jgi:hypothetical protein